MPFLRLAPPGPFPVFTLLLTLAAGGAAPAQAPRYTAVDLGRLEEARGINAAGEVAGWDTILPGSMRPVLLAGGAATDLSDGSAVRAYANDVNNSRMVVGSSVNADGAWRATLWTAAGLSQDLGVLSSPPTNSSFYSEAVAINDSGLIVGFSDFPDYDGPRAVLWRDGVIIDLGSLGGASSVAWDINNSGVIVGAASGPGGWHAAVWRDGVAADLGTLDGTWSEATAINEAGWIVGVSTLSGSQRTRATLWRDGAVIDLGVPAGGLNSRAAAINSAGDILGSYVEYEGGPDLPFLRAGGVMYDFRALLVPESPVRDFQLSWFAEINDAGQFAATATVNGESRVFLFTPVNVPEPSAAGLAVCAAAAGPTLRRRNR